MSWIKRLEWDSDIFNLSMAAINVPQLSADMMPRINSEVTQKNIHFLQYLSRCDDMHSIYQAEMHGFHFIDIRMTFQKILSATERMPDKKDNIHFGLATTSDIPALIGMSAGLYQDFRYYTDMRFPRDKVDIFYQTWLSNAVHGKYDHLCYGLFIDRTPIGYCTLRYNDQHAASIGLLGIAKKYQRQSLGHYLLQRVCAELFHQGYKEIHVVTQGKNIGAQRTYQGHGFKTMEIDMWYHKWFGR